VPRKAFAHKKAAQRKRVANNIRVLRTHAGLSQRELARLLGVKPVAVWSWEHERAMPAGDLALKLSQILGVTVEDLYQKDYKLTVQAA